MSSPLLAKFPYYNVKKCAAILDDGWDPVFRKWLDGKSVPVLRRMVESSLTVSPTLPIKYLGMESGY